MVMIDVSKQFDAYDIECTSKRLKARATALRKDIEAARECRRWFKRWCVRKRDCILQMLDDPTQTFSPADRESWLRFCNEVADRLRGLEAECLPGDEPPLTRPDAWTARRLFMP
jgi:hypothetical protein